MLDDVIRMRERGWQAIFTISFPGELRRDRIPALRMGIAPGVDVGLLRLGLGLLILRFGLLFPGIGPSHPLLGPLRLGLGPLHPGVGLLTPLLGPLHPGVGLLRPGIGPLCPAVGPSRPLGLGHYSSPWAITSPVWSVASQAWAVMHDLLQAIPENDHNKNQKAQGLLVFSYLLWICSASSEQASHFSL